MINTDSLKPQYVPQVAEIEKSCFSTPWSEDAFWGEVSNPVATYFVATEGDLVLGFAGVHIILGEGYITNIAVREDARRRGIGRVLLSKVIDLCREKGCFFLTLEVRESNCAAKRLYESCGFETIGRRKGFYEKPTEDAIIMTLFFKGENNEAV